ncbi:MAG: DUF4407 domain-containing protein, partial [Bacteroidales bacterium]|nr:DUF4407 domain-containing protein [Bacteroidales bacterium]
RSTSRTDTLTGKVESESIYQLARIPNPKIAYLSTIDNKISELNNIISQHQQRLFNMRLELENELRNHKGFLDEIKVMISILTSSKISIAIWLLIFSLFFFIELFVLINKTNDTDDYTKMLLHQAEMNDKKIEALKKNFT